MNAKINLKKVNGKFLLTKCTRKTKPAIKNSLFIYLLLVASFRQAPPDGGRENRRTIYVHNRNNPIIKGSTFCGRRFEEEHDVAADWLKTADHKCFVSAVTCWTIIWMTKLSGILHCLTVIISDNIPPRQNQRWDPMIENCSAAFCLHAAIVSSS